MRGVIEGGVCGARRKVCDFGLLEAKSDVESTEKSDGKESAPDDNSRRTDRELYPPCLVQWVPRAKIGPSIGPGGHDDAGASGQARASWDRGQPPQHTSRLLGGCSTSCRIFPEVCPNPHRLVHRV